MTKPPTPTPDPTATPLDWAVAEMRTKLYAEARQWVVPAHTITALEQRSDAGGQQLVIEGSAAVFDSPTLIDYGSFAFEEVIARGAFRKLIARGADILCLADHCGEPLGRVSNGALTIVEDVRALTYRNVMPDTQHGIDTWKLVQRGDYPGCSFTFYVAEESGDAWDRSAPRPAGLSSDTTWYGRRTIREFSQVDDIGPVKRPYYEDTDVTATTTGGDDAAGERSAPQGGETRGESQGSDDTASLQRRARAAAARRRAR